MSLKMNLRLYMIELLLCYKRIAFYKFQLEPMKSGIWNMRGHYVCSVLWNHGWRMRKASMCVIYEGKEWSFIVLCNGCIKFLNRIQLGNACMCLNSVGYTSDVMESWLSTERGPRLCVGWCIMHPNAYSFPL